jgi:hypothetical protein
VLRGPRLPSVRGKNGAIWEVPYKHTKQEQSIMI